MSQGSQSQSERDFKQKGMKKISEFITKFDSILLPRTNNQAIRDRIDDEHDLLSNLESNSLMHSILTGCLAIDSSLTNIVETENTLILGLLQDMTSLLSNHRLLSDSLSRLFESEDGQQSLAPWTYLKKMEDDIIMLSHHLHELPYAHHNQQFQQQYSAFELVCSATTLKAQRQSLDSSQNPELEKKLNAASNKIAVLQSQLRKVNQQTAVQDLKREHSREKQYLNRQIMELEDELQAFYKYKNMNLIALLEELEAQNYQLREERKRNQQIIHSIQEKMDCLSFDHHESKIQPVSRGRTSRNYVRHSELDGIRHYNGLRQSQTNNGAHYMSGRTYTNRQYCMNGTNNQIRNSANYSHRHQIIAHGTHSKYHLQRQTAERVQGNKSTFNFTRISFKDTDLGTQRNQPQVVLLGKSMSIITHLSNRHINRQETMQSEDKHHTVSSESTEQGLSLEHQTIDMQVLNLISAFQ